MDSGAAPPHGPGAAGRAWQDGVHAGAQLGRRNQRGKLFDALVDGEGEPVLAGVGEDVIALAHVPRRISRLNGSLRWHSLQPLALQLDRM